MKVSVLIPSYNRPNDLLKCLKALSQQEHLADEVLVVARVEDSATRNALADLPCAESIRLRIVDAEPVGMIGALNAGLAAATGDIICMTDDDASPRRDWIKRIAPYYTDPLVAGVGGRDWVHVRRQPITGQREPVGLINSNGRVVGNHHLGAGAPREVDVLKGANMSYRAAYIKPIGFDKRLKGAGAQVNNELGLCLALRRQGKKLIYDPEVQVDHFPAERFDDDARSKPSMAAIGNAAYNLFLSLCEHFGGSDRTRMWNWYRLVGTREVPGLAQVLRFLLKGDLSIFARWRIVRRAAADALRDARR